MAKMGYYKKLAAKQGLIKKQAKTTVVAPSVKKYVNKAINKNGETKYFDTFSNTNDGTNQEYSMFPVPYPTDTVPAHGCACCPLNFSASNPAVAATPYPNTGLICQGVDNYGHFLGDSVKVTGIRLNMQFIRDIASEYPDVYGLIVKESEVADRANLGTVGDIGEFLVSLTDIPDFIQMRPVDNMARLKNWKILKRFKISFNTVNSPCLTKFKSISLSFKGHKQTYTDSATASQTVKDRIWLITYGLESDVNKQTYLQFQSRMSYKDS